MPNPMYISAIEGAKQGKIEGGNIQKGREGWIEVLEFEHVIRSPRDISTGQAAGKRQHGPLKIVKAIDKASPLLFNALVTNENLSSIEFKFFLIDRTGAEKNYYTIKLGDATISEIKAYMPNARDPNKDRYGHHEEVAFTYDKITWEHDGGIMAEDSWLAPHE